MNQLKTSLMILALAAVGAVSMKAQDKKLIIRQGHRDEISMLVYSPDGKYLYTAGMDKVIKKWDVNTGIDVATFYGHEAGVTCLEITTDGLKLISGDLQGRIIIRDPDDGSVPLKVIDAHTAAVNVIKMMPDGGQFASGSADKTVKIWNLAGGQAVKTIEGFTGAVKSIGISPDGTRMMSGGQRTNDVEFLLIDLENGTIIDDALKHVKGAGAAKAYTYAVLSGFSVAANLVKGNVGRDMLDFYTMTYSNIEFAGDGGSALVSMNMYLPMTAAKGEEEKNGGSTVSIVELNEDRTRFKDVMRPRRWMIDYPNTRALFNEDQTKIIANVRHSINIYDMAHAEFPERAREASNYEPPLLKEFTGDVSWLNSLALSPDYRTVASSGEDRSISLWDIRSGRLVRKLEGYINPALAVEVTPDGRSLLVGSLDRDMAQWDLATGQMIRTFRRSSNVNHIDISADGRYLVTTAVGTRFVKYWNIERGTIVKTFMEKNDDITWTMFDREPGFILTASEDGTVRKWSIETGKDRKQKDEIADLDDHFRRNNLAARPEGNTVSMTREGNQAFTLRQEGRVTDAVFTSDGRYLVTSNELGEVILFDAASGKKTVSFVQTGDFDFIACTPDYYYTCSKGASGAIAFRQDGELLTFSQMELTFNRPDIIAQRIDYAAPELVASYKAAWERRLKRLGFSGAAMEGLTGIPELRVDYMDLPLATTERAFTYHIHAADDRHPISRIDVNINDVPVFGSRGLNLSAAGSGEIDREISVELSRGLNRITTTVVNDRGMESMPGTFEVNYDAGYFIPDLYIAAVGVSQYADQDYNLAFAAKDAGDMVREMESSEAFAKVHSRILTDGKATEEGIKGLRPFLEQAGIDDVVIIFIAGHGVLDPEYNYYFGTCDMNFSTPSDGGLPYGDLEALLDGLPCRKKLLFMDTCHSGELDASDVEEVRAETKRPGSIAFRSTGKEIVIRKDAFGLRNTLELSKTLFSDLRNGTGATVISAAGGTEFALEGVNAENGLFTSSFLEGLNTRRADLNRDRVYTVSELRAYISDRVTRLSGGKQVPTSREENLSNDFRIY